MYRTLTDYVGRKEGKYEMNRFCKSVGLMRKKSVKFSPLFKMPDISLATSGKGNS